MAKLAFAQHMAASPALVSAFFVPQRMPYWYAAEMHAEFEVLGGASDFAAGQKIRITGKLGSRETSLTVVVTRFQFGRVLEWQFQDVFGVRGLQSWEIFPDGERTLVRMRDEYEMPGKLGRAFDWILTRHAVRRRDRAWLSRLQRLVERR